MLTKNEFYKKLAALMVEAEVWPSYYYGEGWRVDSDISNEENLAKTLSELAGIKKDDDAIEALNKLSLLSKS